jgi:uncharacterized iron-regulated membrane protein
MGLLNSAWRQWLDRPERLWARHVVFQIHFWVGAMLAAYVFAMSVSGSLIVFHDELFALGISVNGIVDFHTNLLAGSTGRWLNGLGGLWVTLLCLTGAVIWWPGVEHWRRSLTVEWGARFPRLNWDVHSAFGFWGFPLVLMWGVSAVYMVFPYEFSSVLRIDPAGRLTVWLTELHFGRLGWLSQAAWVLLGLLPAVLAFTGMFICCRRVIFHKPSNPRSVGTSA